MADDGGEEETSVRGEVGEGVREPLFDGCNNIIKRRGKTFCFN